MPTTYPDAGMTYTRAIGGDGQPRFDLISGSKTFGLNRRHHSSFLSWIAVHPNWSIWHHQGSQAYYGSNMLRQVIEGCLRDVVDQGHEQKTYRQAGPVVIIREGALEFLGAGQQPDSVEGE